MLMEVSQNQAAAHLFAQTTVSLSEFSALLGDIYQGPMEQVPWGKALEHIRRQLNANYATLILRSPATDRPGLMVNASEHGGSTLAGETSYNNYYYALDPFVGLPSDRVVTIDYSKDGKYFATGGGAPTEDGEIRVFNAADGKPAFEVKSGHSDTVFGVCFSPDTKLLATCGADKFVKVWEVPSGKFVKAFEGHTHHVLDVGWKPDGKLLASGEPTPISYATPKPAAILEEDRIIEAWPLNLAEERMTTIPVAEAFER